MATHAAFLRKEGIDYTMAKNADKTIGVSPAHFNPNAAFGNVYWVDKQTGSDSSDGLSPINAFLTVAAAITASNLTVGSYDMNTIYVNAQTYSEDLTVFPKNCNVIGIGSKTRISGNQTLTSNVGWNSRWWNFEFRSGGDSAPIITIPNSGHGVEFHNCRIKNNSANTTIGIQFGDGSDMIVDNCYFGGNPQLPIAIKFAASTNIGCVVNDNRIGATTTGIELAASLGSSYQNLIIGNSITRQDPNSQNQMATGIKELKTDGHSGFAIHDNNISAVDAILFTYTGGVNYHQWATIRNRTGQDATAAWEDA